jgi:hypothetical protein
LRTSGPFPGLACGRRKLPGAFGLPLGLFQALAGPFELVFSDTHALLGDIRLQPDPRERLAGGFLFAACLFHRRPAKRKKRSLTQGSARFQPGKLSTKFVHNYVDRPRSPAQTPMYRKGLRRGEQVFATG